MSVGRTGATSWIKRNGDISVVVGRAAVLQPCLPVVVFLAKRSPVASVPEQNRIASVRTNVVNHRGLDVPSLGSTHDAQWMSGEKLLAGLLPRSPVSAGGCRARILWMKRTMLLAVLSPALHQLRTAWVSTGALGPIWHLNLSLIALLVRRAIQYLLCSDRIQVVQCPRPMDCNEHPSHEDSCASARFHRYRNNTSALH